MTRAEKVLWALLRAGQLGYKFRRQHPMGPFVLDFFCFEAGLVVEVDGPYHLARRARDRQRDRWLRAEGLTVVHLTNQEVLTAPERALARIRKQLFSWDATGPGPAPSPSGRGAAREGDATGG